MIIDIFSREVLKHNNRSIARYIIYDMFSHVAIVLGMT